MMKKLILAVALFAVAGVGIWFSLRPSLLTVRVVLAGTDVDVTDAVFVVVGTPREGAMGEVSHMTTNSISDSFDVPHQYSVSPNTLLDVFVVGGFFENIHLQANVGRWGHDTLVIPLDAAMVSATLQFDDDPSHGQRRLALAADSNIVGREFPENGPLTMLLKPGEHGLIATHGLTSDARDVSLTAGEVRQVEFDTRLGQTTTTVDFGKLEFALLPPATIALTSEDGNRFAATVVSEGHAIQRPLKYGTYQTTLIFDHETERNTNIEPIALGETIIDASVSATDVSLRVMSVQLDVSGMLEDELVGKHAMLFAATGDLFYARGDIVDNRAQLIFEPRKDDGPQLEYYVAIRDRDTVISLQNIGRPSIDEPTQIQMERGGDLEICKRIFPESHCTNLISAGAQ